jgi:hypothetical protein
MFIEVNIQLINYRKNETKNMKSYSHKNIYDWMGWTLEVVFPTFAFTNSTTSKNLPL